jgi:hypothetical protein
MANIENGSAVQPAENTQTQTLFRFVSLRSPQLSDDKGQNKRFILAPERLKNDNVFYIPVTTGTGSKLKLLQTAAANFKNSADCYSDVNTLKNNFTLLYDFSVWLARNKSTCTFDEVKAQKDSIFDLNNYTFPNIITLWNNLIYQVVTQKDFYIKETVMQMLLGLHVLESFAPTEDEVKVLLNARIVLPKKLMLDDDNSHPVLQSFSQLYNKENGKISSPSEEMEGQQMISTAKIKLGRYEALKKNLSATEKQYNKDYQASYKSMEEGYRQETAPTIAEYNDAVAKAKEEFCKVRIPDTKYDPSDPCQQPKQIPYPDIPKFEFEFRPEISGSSLVTSLKSKNLETLLDLLEFDFSGKFDPQRPTSEDIRKIDSLLEGRTSFAEITSIIDENTEATQNIIVENTARETETYTSIGGIIMPVSRVETIPFTYQLCSKTIVRLTSFDLSIDVPSGWDIAGASYTANFTSGNISGTYYTKTRTGNRIFLNNLFASSNSDGIYFPQTGNFTIDIQITFSNGKSVSFTARIESLKLCYSSSFEFINETGEKDDEKDFIPSGFGFKQIGIADYLKVEQNTHAYVEGEVAHIENVMAREYREKSTRRLRRSENTTTSSSDTEREQVNDTTTANRFEMQTEISKMAQEASDKSTQFGLNVNYNSSFGLSVNSSLGLSNAYHTSKEESTRQAMTQSQDITSRAMDRIVNKVHEERIEKIIDEFEENNSHGLDNRKGDKHVVGVYRWVDKLMKNQIYNYGKRMMFEFMIPEPAKLHLLGMKETKSADQTNLTKPDDPRAAGNMQIADYSALTNDVKLRYWAGKYNAELESRPGDIYYVSKSFSERDPAFMGSDEGKIQIVSGSGELEIPKDYEVQEVEYRFNTYPHGFNGYHQAFMTIAGRSTSWINSINSTQMGGVLSNFNVREKLAYSFTTGESPIINGSINAKCVLTPEAKTAWMQKTFNVIIKAYEDALIEYNNAVVEENNKAVVIKDSNPNFYRQIENTVLRKNCISYMADRAVNSTHGYGFAGLTQGSMFTDYETNLTSKLDKYTAFVKFMEQAFEWENLSYYLYPFYWGDKQNWMDLYQSENTDPLFRAFLQSGMARVVATVRPGFEDAVQFYLATGKIWNGGEVPVIGDELYLSIVDEMKQPKGVKQGKAWLTRLPTTLNILQAESIGLKVRHALPFTTENPDDFEIPSEVITEDKFNFEKNDSLLGGSVAEKWIEITLDRMDQYANIAHMDNEQVFPRVYECMGNTITIDRDAVWVGNQPTTIYYKTLTDELSLIDGVKAIPTGSNGITFKVNVNKIKTFTFKKPDVDEGYGLLKFTTDGETYLKISSPEINKYGFERVLDKNRLQIPVNEYTGQVPLSKFLV